jgi:hypothetical protein
MANGPEFFQTVMGHQFYEGTMPRIAKALEKIAASLDKKDDAPDPRWPTAALDALIEQQFNYNATHSATHQRNIQIEQLSHAIAWAVTDTENAKEGERDGSPEKRQTFWVAVARKAAASCRLFNPLDTTKEA